MATVDTTAGTFTPPPGSRRPQWLKPIGRTFALLLLGLLFAFPLYWTVTMSFKPLPEWNPPGKVFWFPDNPTVENYTSLLGLKGDEGTVFATRRSRPALGPLKNSLITASAGTAL